MIFKDDEYQTYDDQPLDELGEQQEAPEEEEVEEVAVVGGEEQQEEDNDTTAQDSQEFETEMVLSTSSVCLCIRSHLSLIRF